MQLGEKPHKEAFGIVALVTFTSGSHAIRRIFDVILPSRPPAELSVWRLDIYSSWRVCCLQTVPRF